MAEEDRSVYFPQINAGEVHTEVKTLIGQTFYIRSGDEAASF